MDDQACPKCKTTKYRNPSLKLMVNVCGHALCDNCVELLFVKGSGSCPECKIPLRRNNFRLQLFEDSYVEKEVDIRKRVLKDFNKREDDFATLREYNDYLEEVESIIYNLTNNSDVEATKRKIEQYKKENRSLIARNKTKLSHDEELIEELLDLEHAESNFHRQQFLREELEERKTKVKNKEALIDELMYSDAPAGEIVASHAQKTVGNATKEHDVEKIMPKKFSTGIRFRQQEAFLPVPKTELPVYEYEEFNLDICGPPLPKFDSLQKDGYLAHVRKANDSERAGGFLSEIACFRALEEAMCGLFYDCNELEYK